MAWCAIARRDGGYFDPTSLARIVSIKVYFSYETILARQGINSALEPVFSAWQNTPMQRADREKIVASFRSEIARSQRLIERAKAHLAVLTGDRGSRSRRDGPSVEPQMRPGGVAALCREALQKRGEPQHTNELFEFCHRQGSNVSRPSYVYSTLFRRRHTFTYLGKEMWSLKKE